MAEHAIDAGLVYPMAIHAAVHRDIRLAEQPFPLGDFPMAGLTFHAGIEMILVAEENEAWDLVHANPWDRFLARRKSR